MDAPTTARTRRRAEGRQAPLAAPLRTPRGGREADFTTLVRASRWIRCTGRRPAPW